MAFKKKVEKKEETIEILQIEKVKVSLYILGTTPLLMNRMSKKTRETLLLPPLPMRNRAARAEKLKHEPIAEFNEAVYRCQADDAPTLIHVPNGAFKKAIAQAALDIPGATKAQIGRLVSVTDPTVHLFGKPYLHMCPVRPPGQAPDIRTRAIFPQWACKVTFGFIRRLISERDVLNLVAAAGVITGVGDGRPEKGALDFGQWDVVSANDKDWNRIVKSQGRKVQVEAMNSPQAYDAEAEELLAWFSTELLKRDSRPASELADDVDIDDDVGDEDEFELPVKHSNLKEAESDQQTKG
jgi:hypothetical protein